MLRIQALLIAVLASAAVHAHHSRAMFEASEVLALEGVISKTTWRNPHVYSAGLDSSEQKRVIEQYKLSGDGFRLHYSHTLIDPNF